MSTPARWLESRSDGHTEVPTGLQLVAPLVAPEPSPYLQRLDVQGVFDEVEAQWADEDAGIDTCSDAMPVDDLIAALRSAREA